MSKEQQDTKKAALAEMTRMSKANGGKITPEALVAAARDPDSPLHDYFEWDDSTAAEKYRMMQARTMLRSCHYNVTINNRKVELPYYMRDPEMASMDQGYVEISRVKTEEDLSRDILVNEFRKAASQLRKARDIAAFFQMTEEVDAMIETLGIMQGRLETAVTV